MTLTASVASKRGTGGTGGVVANCLSAEVGTGVGEGEDKKGGEEKKGEKFSHFC